MRLLDFQGRWKEQPLQLRLRWRRTCSRWRAWLHRGRRARSAPSHHTDCHWLLAGLWRRRYAPWVWKQRQNILLVPYAWNLKVCCKLNEIIDAGNGLVFILIYEAANTYNNAVTPSRKQSHKSHISLFSSWTWLPCGSYRVYVALMDEHGHYRVHVATFQ